MGEFLVAEKSDVTAEPKFTLSIALAQADTRISQNEPNSPVGGAIVHTVPGNKPPKRIFASQPP